MDDLNRRAYELAREVLNCVPDAQPAMIIAAALTEARGVGRQEALDEARAAVASQAAEQEQFAAGTQDPVVAETRKLMAEGMRSAEWLLGRLKDKAHGR